MDNVNLAHDLIVKFCDALFPDGSRNGEFYEKSGFCVRTRIVDTSCDRLAQAVVQAAGAMNFLVDSGHVFHGERWFKRIPFCRDQEAFVVYVTWAEDGQGTVIFSDK